MRKAGKVVGKKRGRPASLLGTPTSSRANSTSRVNSPVMAKNFDTPKRRNATRTSLPDSPVPNKMARKTPARHQDLPLDSVRSDNVDHFPEWTKSIRQICQNCSKFRRGRYKFGHRRGPELVSAAHKAYLIPAFNVKEVIHSRMRRISEATALPSELIKGGENCSILVDDLVD
ncbi:hypothetical protein EVAR_20128_1 [Eumeta japonica]|uniref:Uncharacterized protein n=1 Tax=Eumeta variegata TaxID=151549 RepID=A0A4C1V2A4_EUMVA|nr:hypothetical protein EVAR_20128_1 [Eumeta japonica]